MVRGLTHNRGNPESRIERLRVPLAPMSRLFPMAREVRNKVKPSVWLAPTCLDKSDTFRNRQAAHKDFKQDCRGDEEGGIDVVAADALDETSEFNEFPASAGDSEALKGTFFFTHRPSSMRKRKTKSKRR